MKSDKSKQSCVRENNLWRVCLEGKKMRENKKREFDSPSTIERAKGKYLF